VPAGKSVVKKYLKSRIQGIGVFHYENEPAHSALYVYDLLANNKVTVIPQPP
jgi:hypothetical protein